jgi:hypothetical protein
MYQNVAKEDHKVNPHPESAEMDGKEFDMFVKSAAFRAALPGDPLQMEPEIATMPRSQTLPPCSVVRPAMIPSNGDSLVIRKVRSGIRGFGDSGQSRLSRPWQIEIQTFRFTNSK